jgi:SAM-dependent methyltransferase
MAHQWDSAEYVEDWYRHDTQAQLLTLPMEIALALVTEDGLEVGRVIDLGAGPGRFLGRFLDEFPDAEGFWVDSSPHMAEIAMENLAPVADRVTFALADAARLEDIDPGPADVVVSSRMVHHLSPEEIRRVYGWVAAALGDRGYFFNLDHYGSPTGWERRYRSIRRALLGRRTGSEAHQHDQPFQLLDRHLEWLAGAGFESADVAWKAFHTALLVGRKGS